MIKTLMYHKVENFAKWKEAFDSFASIRKAAGERSYFVGTMHNEPNTAYVVNEWDSMEAYQAFMENPALAEAMKSAGVAEKPHVLIFNEVDKGAL
jgi:quinol monooxygenase YgiN